MATGLDMLTKVYTADKHQYYRTSGKHEACPCFSLEDPFGPRLRRSLLGYGLIQPKDTGKKEPQGVGTKLLS
ncbi:hypothetical protein HAX54_037694, partial [Datura stramonium]|nr:hypothetical protein [Datura stramonium]